MGDTPPAQTASESGSGSKSTSGSGPGSAGDFVQPFADALTAAAKAAATDSAGDPKVITAIQLGWLMKELTNAWSPNPMPDGLAPYQAAPYQAQALQLTRFLDSLNLTGLDSAAVSSVTDPLKSGAAKKASQQIEPQVIVALMGAGARLPNAYALGGQLRALISVRDSRERQGGPVATAPDPKSLVGALDSLSSDLPSHAARSVANSLGEWSLSQDPSKAALTDFQVNLWRSVIVGEKKGTELLEPDDYLEAAKQLERKFVRRALTSKWLWAVVVGAVGLFCGGIYLLFAANGHAGKLAAGASGVLAAFGLTWKGIGGTLGKLVAKLEAPLWGAELDDAITDAITLPNVQTGAPASKREGLAYADRLGRASSA